MNIGIVGSRSFDNYFLLEKTIERLIQGESLQIDAIISGGAKGADSLAEQYADKHKIKKQIFLPAPPR